MTRRLLGLAVAIGAVMAVGAVMFPLRAHLSVATTALVLVIPVVAAVAAGGFPAGVVAVAAGFLVYDFVFMKVRAAAPKAVSTTSSMPGAGSRRSEGESPGASPGNCVQARDSQRPSSGR